MSKDRLAKRQNTEEALKLLYLQRKLYNKSKNWGRLRIIGVLVLGVVSPVIIFFAPSATIPVAAIAAMWLTLSRTWFANRERDYAHKAALIQNEFDCLVFGIEQNMKDDSSLTLEERADILSVPDFNSAIRRERLEDWYPFNDSASETLNIAVAQRANAAYTDRLLRANSSLVLCLSIAWIVIVVSFAIYQKLPAFELVLGIIAPVLPGLLDNLENWLNVVNASKQRRSLAKEIEDMTTGGDDISPHLQHWQQRTYELRLTTPYLPNLLYWALRNKNEAAMKSAADALLEAGGNHGKR